jgi:hypothetical protein
MMDNIKEVYLSFLAKNRYYTTEEARVLMVNCIEELLERINSNLEVRDYLDHYPFTEKGIDFSIEFLNEKGEDVSDGYIAYVSIINETLFYYIYRPETDMLEKIYKEPYLEALQIVQDKQKQIVEKIINDKTKQND